MYFWGCNFLLTLYTQWTCNFFIKHASNTRNWVANWIGTLIKKGEKTSSLCFGVLDTCVDHCEWVWCWWGVSRRLDVKGPDPPGQWNHAITSNSSWMFVITDLTPEEQQLLETIRERKQKLLKEIQVGLYASVFLFLLLLNTCKLWSLLFCFYFHLCLTYQSHWYKLHWILKNMYSIEVFFFISIIVPCLIYLSSIFFLGPLSLQLYWIIECSAII